MYLHLQIRKYRVAEYQWSDAPCWQVLCNHSAKIQMLYLRCELEYSWALCSWRSSSVEAYLFTPSTLLSSKFCRLTASKMLTDQYGRASHSCSTLSKSKQQTAQWVESMHCAQDGCLVEPQQPSCNMHRLMIGLIHMQSAPYRSLEKSAVLAGRCATWASCDMSRGGVRHTILLLHGLAVVGADIRNPTYKMTPVMHVIFSFDHSRHSFWTPIFSA